MIDVTILPALKDNYIYILRSGGEVAVVDPGEAAPVIQFLEERGLKPTLILNTHHHGDHCAGNAELMRRYGCGLIAPAYERGRIEGITHPVDAASRLTFGGEDIRVIPTPGHTAGAVCYHFPRSNLCFTGDTLFSMGCGRLFEGTADTMWVSLMKLMALAPETLLYCGHEYTLANGAFCTMMEPDNAAIRQRIKEAEDLIQRGLPTLPVPLSVELATNVFLRAGSAAAFARLRSLKDTF